MLLPGLEVYYEAFQELGNDRQTGFGLGPIPFVALDRYADRYGYEGESFEYLRAMVRAMDEFYLKYQKDNEPEVPGGNKQ